MIPLEWILSHSHYWIEQSGWNVVAQIAIRGIRRAMANTQGPCGIFDGLGLPPALPPICPPNPKRLKRCQSNVSHCSAKSDSPPGLSAKKEDAVPDADTLDDKDTWWGSGEMTPPIELRQKRAATSISEGWTWTGDTWWSNWNWNGDDWKGYNGWKGDDDHEVEIPAEQPSLPDVVDWDKEFMMAFEEAKNKKPDNVANDDKDDPEGRLEHRAAFVINQSSLRTPRPKCEVGRCET